MDKNNLFPVLDAKSWKDSIRMARTEPNKVREAIQAAIKKLP